MATATVTGAQFSRTADPAFFVTLQQVENDPYHARYVSGRRDAARAECLQVLMAVDTRTGKRVALVESRSHPGCWHIVRRYGNRYICDCPAMRGENGAINRRITCIHAQTIALADLSGLNY